jgi:hypothetical protein
MANRFTDTIKAHKNVVIAAVAVTALLGYVLPGNMPAAQADWSPGWWTAFTTAFSSAESEAEGGDAEAESGDALAVQVLEGDIENEIEQDAEVNQANLLDDRDDVIVDQIGLYGNTDNEAVVNTGGNTQINAAEINQDAENNVEISNEAESGDAEAEGGDAEAEAEANANSWNGWFQR